MRLFCRRDYSEGRSRPPRRDGSPTRRRRRRLRRLRRKRVRRRTARRTRSRRRRRASPRTSPASGSTRGRGGGVRAARQGQARDANFGRGRLGRGGVWDVKKFLLRERRGGRTRTRTAAEERVRTRTRGGRVARRVRGADGDFADERRRGGERDLEAPEAKREERLVFPDEWVSSGPRRRHRRRRRRRVPARLGGVRLGAADRARRRDAARVVRDDARALEAPPAGARAEARGARDGDARRARTPRLLLLPLVDVARVVGREELHLEPRAARSFASRTRIAARAPSAGALAARRTRRLRRRPGRARRSPSLGGRAVGEERRGGDLGAPPRGWTSAPDSITRSYAAAPRVRAASAATSDRTRAAGMRGAGTTESSSRRGRRRGEARVAPL